MYAVQPAIIKLDGTKVTKPVIPHFVRLPLQEIDATVVEKVVVDSFIDRKSLSVSAKKTKSARNALKKGAFAMPQPKKLP